VRGSRIEVPAGGLLFGRAAGPAGRLGDDPALSRWHARLDLAGEGLVVEDLASSNGTLLNGQRISGRQPVRPGDVVTVGASQLQLQALPAPSTAPAQPHTLATTVLPALAAAHPAPPAPAAAHPAPPAPADAHPAPSAPAAPAPAPAASPAAPRPAAPPAPAAPLAAAPPAPAPVPAAAHPAAPPRPVPAQPGLPLVPGLPDLVELSGVQPLFVAAAGRYLGRVIRGYLVSAVLLGVLAVLLEVVRSHLGVTLSAAVNPGRWARPVAGSLALSGVVLAVAAYLRSASTRLSLHPGRLDIERGLLRREATAIDLHRLRRVTLSQTALQRLTGDGTLLLELADHAGPIPVTGLARGQQLHQIYEQLTALTPASHR
jgi:membrane protein YdbS with pleckstrin-like domain